MGDRVSDILNLTITLVVIVAIIGLGMVTLGTTRRFNRYTEEQLAQEVVAMKEEEYTAYDNKIITGREAKNLMVEFGGQDVCFLVNTISLNNTTNSSLSLSGTIIKDGATADVPVTQIENISSKISKGTEITPVTVVNYGAVLTNSVTGPGSAKSKASVSSYRWSGLGNILSFSTKSGVVGYAQRLSYDSKKGFVRTSGGLATDPTNVNSILRYDETADTDNSLATMYMPDLAQFKVYLVRDLANDVLGFVFIQQPGE